MLVSLQTYNGWTGWWNGLLQRMYAEIKMAVGPGSLFIKSSNRSGEVQWWCQGSTGSSAIAVDVSDLPGPFGARTLHVVDSAPNLPKVQLFKQSSMLGSSIHL